MLSRDRLERRAGLRCTAEMMSDAVAVVTNYLNPTPRQMRHSQNPLLKCARGGPSPLGARQGYESIPGRRRQPQ